MLDKALTNPAATRAIQTHIATKAIQTLMGMVSAIVVDEHLHDREIALLSTWLADNSDTAAHWPGSVIAAQVRAVLEDGVVTDAERAHLLAVLTGLAKIVFIFVDGNIHIKSAFDPNKEEASIYQQSGQ